MALVTMKKLLEHARSNRRGVGAFSVGNMDTPIILQIAEVRLKHSPLALYGNDDGTGHLCECASSYRSIQL